MVTPELIKTLRARTNAGVLDCKKALTESNGDLDKAAEWLREKGIAAAAKKADRIAAEGKIFFYDHMGGKIGVMVEINCETDFVARNDQFNEFGKNIAMHIAAARPSYVRIEEVPASVLEHEKEILKAQALNEGKPAHLVEKMVEGRIKKFYKENVLLEQEYVKDPDKNIATLVNEATLTIGEKISIRRFVRYEMGEGLEKRQDDFVAEVMNQSKGNK